MPSEQTQLFCDEDHSALQKEDDIKSEIISTIRSAPKSSILESSCHYELRNVKIDLPKINIPNEVVCKHEIDRYKKLFQCKPQTARKSISINIRYVEEGKSEITEEQGIKMSAKILNFKCSKCLDSTPYSPNDLQKHFQMWHHGELPSYPCEMCSFSANDFQVFKQHRRTHKSTLVKCDICNNGTVYTLLDLTKHFISTHCINGNFQCERCKFSTQDVGTFVQHIYRHNEAHYKCDKCHFGCFSKGELQKHLQVHSNTFTFVCQYCGYGVTRKEYLIRHVTTFHKEHLYAKEKLEREKYEKRIAETSAGLKLILKRYKVGESRKTFWKREKIDNASEESKEENNQVLKTNETQAEDQNRRIEENGKEAKGESVHCEKKDGPAELHSQNPTLVLTGQCNRAEAGPDSALGPLKTSSVQGPTVLMVKNNRIPVPANYSAKFMGFKMVDGKQHIVIKLLPVNKQSLCSPSSQSDVSKPGTANLQPRAMDTTGFLSAGVAAELNDTVFMKASTSFSPAAPVLSGKMTSEKEMALISQMNNVLQTVNDEKSVSFLPATSEFIMSPVNLATKVEARDNVDLWGNHITQSHPQVLGTTIKSPDKDNCIFKPNTYKSRDMHNYCIKYVNSELTDESSSQRSLPFHNYSKVSNPNKLGRVMYEHLQRESSSKMMTQHPISESVLSLVKKENSNPHSLLASVSDLNTQCGTIKAQAEVEEQSIDGQNLYKNEIQTSESIIEKPKWNNFSNVDSPMMPRITSVFSLQSQQASQYLPPEVNQLLQDVLKTKPDVKQDSSNIPNKGLPVQDGLSFQKHEGESKILVTSKDLKVQGMIPVPSDTVGVNELTNDLSLKCNGKQVLLIPQNVKDSEKAHNIAGISTLLKTQSDAIITQQLVKDKLRATTQNLNSLYIQNPFLNSEPKKAVFVQTPNGLFVPWQVANKPGFQVVSGRPLSLINTQGVPASLLLNKQPGMIVTFSNGKREGASGVKTESAQSCDGITKEPCGTSTTCLTPALCSTIGSCLNMKNNAENNLSLKGPYFIKTASSSEKTVPPPVPSEHQGTRLTILDSGKQQNEVLPKPPVYALLPDGKQAVLLKCVMPNKTELLKPTIVQNSTYQNLQPKNPDGTPQKILLKVFNPVLNVNAATSLSGSHSASSLQKASVSSNQTTEGGQKEPESSRDALPLSLNNLMPANEVVVNSTAACPESLEPVCVTNCSDTRVLRSKADCTDARSCNRKKVSKRNFSRIKTRVGIYDSETAFATRDRNCKRKCRDGYQEPQKKATLHRKCKEKAKPEDFHDMLRPRLPKDAVRMLRVFPFSSKQLVKCPWRNQPVVVLNHPDADAPEVVNVMKTIAKFKGHVLKVTLSERTLNALLKPVCCNPSKTTYVEFPKRHKTCKPLSSVKERFVLKLTLKKTSKNNYQIVKTTSGSVQKARFKCWFCGRVFDNQDDWAGHGQRHLVEATRDWNMLQ
ncbi:zinc finger protein 518A [Echinops telfairi]|uniref:Zinc finger protein 518A n=2 Tax=Echinops telfairi TaxID=9371 RepID=A0AC55D730_ECHTE|nr:zinc finger protein 518A [Echinops telfairi]XP_045147551.1 zinc finger protein 518A [Echinops telfairi]